MITFLAYEVWSYHNTSGTYQKVRTVQIPGHIEWHGWRVFEKEFVRFKGESILAARQAASQIACEFHMQIREVLDSPNQAYSHVVYERCKWLDVLDEPIEDRVYAS
jgi:hypothetical protein